MSYTPDDAEGLQRQLARVRRDMAALLVQRFDYAEMHRQLEVYQRQVVRLYFRAARDGLLPAWIRPAADRDEEPPLLPAWERLARALETDGRLPMVDEISEMRVPIIGEDRLEHRSPPERTPLWIQHAVQLVELLIDRVKPARPPATDTAAEDGKRRNRSGKSVGGRRSLPEHEARKREELVGRWNRAKAQGVHQKDFCGDENVSLKYLTKCINWRVQRRRRNQS